MNPQPRPRPIRAQISSIFFRACRYRRTIKVTVRARNRRPRMISPNVISNKPAHRFNKGFPATEAKGRASTRPFAFVFAASTARNQTRSGVVVRQAVTHVSALHGSGLTKGDSHREKMLARFCSSSRQSDQSTLLSCATGSWKRRPACE